MRGTEKYVITIGEQQLDLQEPVVMTIINVTPDSFWSGSRRTTEKEIVDAVDKAVEWGASILDVGGYSSRPAAEDVSPKEEFDRVARAMEIIRAKHPKMAVSIDTFRAEVARKVVERYGDCVINDISAGELDKEMIPTVAALGLPYIAMHMRGTPQTMQQMTDYDDVVESVKGYFAEKITQLEEAGVKQIIIDPGFGFAKNREQNYQLMAGMEKLLEFGYPVLVGVSRKAMIYKTLGVEPKDTLAGTTALNWEALRKGAAIIRVHDTREAVDIVKLHEEYKKAYAK